MEQVVFGALLSVCSAALWGPGRHAREDNGISGGAHGGRREAFWVCGKSWELTCLLWPGPLLRVLKVPLQTGREQGREQV